MEKAEKAESADDVYSEIFRLNRELRQKWKHLAATDGPHTGDYAQLVRMTRMRLVEYAEWKRLPAGRNLAEEERQALISFCDEADKVLQIINKRQLLAYAEIEAMTATIPPKTA